MSPEVKALARDILQIIIDVADPGRAFGGHAQAHARAVGMLAVLGDKRYPEEPRTSLEMVREFHTKMGAPVGDVTRPDVSTRRELRLNLIAEELEELGAALGYNVEVKIYEAGATPDIVEAADALADLRYVVEGAAVEWGIPLDAVTAEVHRSNMTKTGGGERADGKILKGPGYEPPRIRDVLGLRETVVEVMGGPDESPRAVAKRITQDTTANAPVKVVPMVPRYQDLDTITVSSGPDSMEIPLSAWETFERLHGPVEPCAPVRSHTVGDRVEVTVDGKPRIGTVKALDSVAVDIGGVTVAVEPRDVRGVG